MHTTEQPLMMLAAHSPSTSTPSWVKHSSYAKDDRHPEIPEAPAEECVARV